MHSLTHPHNILNWCRLRYGKGSGPIFLDTIRCTGYESHLLRCDHLGLGTVSDSCSHNTEVALVCCELLVGEREGEGRGRKEGMENHCRDSSFTITISLFVC